VRPQQQYIFPNQFTLSIILLYSQIESKYGHYSVTAMLTNVFRNNQHDYYYPRRTSLQVFALRLGTYKWLLALLLLLASFVATFFLI
jgi:hypothetical protein